MDLRQLKYLTAIAELGSFSRAAVLLDMAQPSLSKQIRNLEDSLGQKLLIRNGRGVATTEAGERLTYGAQGAVERHAADPDRLAWVDGLVVAKDWRLDYFAQYLARQRIGVIRVDPAVAGLRLSGVFPLDDAERALRALEPALPIVVTRHTQYWLQVGPRAA